MFSELDGHEQVTYLHDPGSGLRAIVAIHSTALGPALGGTRCLAYASDDAALADVLALSRAMTLKNSLAGLDHGGGKAVILGRPELVKTEASLRAYGRFLAGLGGRYYTACDVGTYSADMDLIARETTYVTGRSGAHGGAGDSSELTAYGVFLGMRATASRAWGTPDLSGRRVGVAGVGKVGRRLVSHVLAAGAEVVVTDVDDSAVRAAQEAHPGLTVVDSTAELVVAPLDIYAPCALGGAIAESTAAVLAARVVCGGANNQLASPGAGQVLTERGILYAPDFVVNAGGVVQVADELHGFSMDRARAKVEGIYATTLAVLEHAEEAGVTPAQAAEEVALRRIEQLGGLRRIWNR